MRVSFKNKLVKLETINSNTSWERMIAHFTDDDLRDCIRFLQTDDIVVREGLLSGNPILADRLRELRAKKLNFTPAEEQEIWDRLKGSR